MLEFKGTSLSFIFASVVSKSNITHPFEGIEGFYRIEGFYSKKLNVIHFLFHCILLQLALDFLLCF